jgi:hypothetical protein
MTRFVAHMLRTCSMSIDTFATAYRIYGPGNIYKHRRIRTVVICNDMRWSSIWLDTCSHIVHMWFMNLKPPGSPVCSSQSESSRDRLCIAISLSFERLDQSLIRRSMATKMEYGLIIHGTLVPVLVSTMHNYILHLQILKAGQLSPCS